MSLLEVRDLEVRYAGHFAVRGVDLDVDAGAIIGLIGPNGAGKTSMFNAIAGVQPCTGSVALSGRDLSRASAYRRARWGLGRTFQKLEVFGSLTAFENIRTAAELQLPWYRRSDRSVVDTASRLIDLLGLSACADVRADAIPTGQARLVELGRALASEPKVLLLDEPASGLDDVESERLGQILVELLSEGMGILLVEHDLQLVMRLCSRTYVLDFGEVIASGTPPEIQRDPRVRAAYIGAED